MDRERGRSAARRKRQKSTKLQRHEFGCGAQRSDRYYGAFVDRVNIFRIGAGGEESLATKSERGTVSAVDSTDWVGHE